MVREGTKISMMRMAFINGETLSPAYCFRRFGIQANTFHRLKNILTESGWIFDKRTEKTPESSISFYTLIARPE